MAFTRCYYRDFHKEAEFGAGVGLHGGLGIVHAYSFAFKNKGTRWESNWIAVLVYNRSFDT